MAPKPKRKAKRPIIDFFFIVYLFSVFPEGRFKQACSERRGLV
ncbi:hypothetical protein EVA_16432 [gut metagenome]|uniref:Uncharacterized protein n=1 Tax=gut metagenome TaxID=749906 RepID=J9C6J2_9ZZZZ